MGFTPTLHTPPSVKSKLPAIKEWGAFLKQLQDRAQEAIRHAQQLTLKHNEKKCGKRTFKPYSLGEKVWLKGTNLELSHPSAKLAPQQYGPFTITRLISPVVYHLDLPPSWKIFSTFHASLLSPYCETIKHGPNFTKPPPDLIKGHEEYKVEQILEECTFGQWKKKQFLVQWKGYSAAHNSWEPAENVNAPELVKEYQVRSHACARVLLLKPEGADSPPLMLIRPRSPPHLASSELFTCTFAGHHINGIQKALEGTSKVRKVWCNNSSLYTSHKARTTAIHEEGHARAQAPINPINPQYPVTTAGSNTHNSTHNHHVADCLESIYEEEEDLGNAGMAQETLHSSHIGEGSPHLERTPPRDNRASSFTLDMGDFMGGALGGGNSINLGPGGAQVHGSTTSRLDGQLPSMEGLP